MTAAYAITASRLRKKPESLPWKDRAWHAGDWVMTGMWGAWSAESRWQQPVNGFYRLTRGIYAQYGRPLPHPEKAIDTILAHAKDRAFFNGRTDDACHVLDVVHPLWLCRKQTAHRRAEIEAWVLKLLPKVLAHWQRNRGFDFVVARHNTSLQGTEMRLSIVYLMSDLLDASNALGAQPLGAQPCGVHRTEAPGRGLVR